MATYKVLQDIEAEDKILGPLTLRQFIYAGVAAICLYICYFLFSRGFGFMVVVFLPIAIASGFFAFPWGRDQPTEIWALAKIRFFLKPRRRIWDQSAIKEVVTVTAPKKEERIVGKGLSETEVTSRLHALADTLDSRGWAVKNANINYGSQGAVVQSSDRLINISSFRQSAPTDVSDIRASDDILDEQNNPVAQQVNSMIEASSKAHRDRIVASLEQPVAPTPKPAAGPKNDYWFLNQPAQPASVPNNNVTFNTQVVSPGMSQSDLPVGTPTLPSQAEENLVHQLDANKGADLSMDTYNEHLRKIQPLSAQKPMVPAPQSAPTPTPQAIPSTQAPSGSNTLPANDAGVSIQGPQPAAQQVTPTQQAAILQLANNDDLNVATLAREAERSGPQDEVVIKLH